MDIPARIGLDPFWAHGRKLLTLTRDDNGGRIRRKLQEWFPDDDHGKRQLLADEFVAGLTRSDSTHRWSADLSAANRGDIVIIRGHWYFRREAQDGRAGCLCYLKGPGEAHARPVASMWVSYEHCVGSTGRMMLSGHKHCAVIGWKQEDEEGITVDPIAIGYLVNGALHDGPYLESNAYQVWPQEIDQFAAVDFSRQARKAAREAVANMVEADIKSKLAAILGEPFLDKDNPAERSDLFTARAILNGVPTSLALVLKGRGAPHKITLVHLGKNGDQLQKAFTEPANVVGVIHTGRIDPTIRRDLDDKCFVQHARLGRMRRWMILDGEDLAKVFEQLGHLEARG